MNIRIYLVFLLLAVLGIGVYFLSISRPKRTTIEISGTFEAKSIDLSVPIPSKVVKIYVREGELVNKGDTILVLDTTDLFLQIQALHQNIQSLESKLSAIDAALEQLKRDLKRIKVLVRKAVSVSKVEKMEAELKIKERERQATVKQIESYRRQSERIRYQMSQLMIITPVKGYIQNLYYEVGEITKPGFPIVTLVVSGRFEFQTYIPQTLLASIHIGDTVDIIPDVYPSMTINGVIEWIGEEAEYTPRNLQTPNERVRLVYPARVNVLNPMVEIKSGMTGVMRWVPSEKRSNKGQKLN